MKLLRAKGAGLRQALCRRRSSRGGEKGVCMGLDAGLTPVKSFDVHYARRPSGLSSFLRGAVGADRLRPESIAFGWEIWPDVGHHSRCRRPRPRDSPSASATRSPLRWPTTDRPIRPRRCRAPDAGVLLHWLRTRPLLHREGDRVLVHAGVLPDWTLTEAEAQAERISKILATPGNSRRSSCVVLEGYAFVDEVDGHRGEEWLALAMNALTAMRAVRLDGAPDFTHSGGPDALEDGNRAWFDASPGRRGDVRRGHRSALGLRGVPGLALDTGCIHGGSLTAVRLEDGAAPGPPGRARRRLSRQCVHGGELVVASPRGRSGARRVRARQLGEVVRPPGPSFPPGVIVPTSGAANDAASSSARVLGQVASQASRSLSATKRGIRTIRTARPVLEGDDCLLRLVFGRARHGRGPRLGKRPGMRGRRHRHRSGA